MPEFNSWNGMGGVVFRRVKRREDEFGNLLSFFGRAFGPRIGRHRFVDQVGEIHLRQIASQWLRILRRDSFAVSPVAFSTTRLIERLAFRSGSIGRQSAHRKLNEPCSEQDSADYRDAIRWADPVIVTRPDRCEG